MKLLYNQQVRYPKCTSLKLEDNLRKYTQNLYNYCTTCSEQCRANMSNTYSTAQLQGNQCPRVAHEWLVGNLQATLEQFTSDSWAILEQLTSDSCGRYVRMHMYVSCLQVKGGYQVKCYTDKYGVNRNCRVTHHWKVSNLLAKREIDHYSRTGTKIICLLGI